MEGREREGCESDIGTSLAGWFCGRTAAYRSVWDEMFGCCLCGSPPVLCEDDGNWWVECSNVHCGVAVASDDPDMPWTLAEAIAAWNKCSGATKGEEDQ